jgi:hypothetical protein
MRPLKDVSVRVTDRAGRVPSTKTDQRGVYAFEWLPPDNYRIEQELPAGLKALSDAPDETMTVDLADEDVTRVGCQADIRARPDGQSWETVGGSQAEAVGSSTNQQKNGDSSAG